MANEITLKDIKNLFIESEERLEKKIMNNTKTLIAESEDRLENKIMENTRTLISESDDRLEKKIMNNTRSLIVESEERIEKKIMDNTRNLIEESEGTIITTIKTVIEETDKQIRVDFTKFVRAEVAAGEERMQNLSIYYRDQILGMADQIARDSQTYKQEQAAVLGGRERIDDTLLNYSPYARTPSPS